MGEACRQLDPSPLPPQHPRLLHKLPPAPSAPPPAASSAMRRSGAIFLLTTLTIVIYLVSSVWTLLSLLVVDGSTDAIHRAELPHPTAEPPSTGRKELIPRILHQTYVNDSIPDHWEDARQTCLKLHANWEYRLWTDSLAREFIAAEYPWFLDTFDGYAYPIQRADAIRYFVLERFGGIYLDLDDGCSRKMDPLLTYSAWLRRTVPTGISNDAMGAIPHHPFFLRVIDALPGYDRSWVLPYITVMGSTGPLFLSVIWRHYNVDLGNGIVRGFTDAFASGRGLGVDGKGASRTREELEMDRVMVLMPDENVGNSWSFFIHYVGSSWHRSDVVIILWMRDHWVFLLFAGTAAFAVVMYCVFSVYRRMLKKSLRTPTRAHWSSFRKRLCGDGEDGYELVPREHDAS